IADAREALDALLAELRGHRIRPAFAERIDELRRRWNGVVDAALAPSGRPLPGQPEIIGAVHGAAGPRDVVVQAAGSLPGDLHKLWRVRDPLGYHVEYAFSCMGYEIAGGLGVRRAVLASRNSAVHPGDDDRDVIVMVGDGSYLMLHTELLTAVAEGLKIIVVLIQNHGYASIGHLSETVGSERFGTRYRYQDARTGDFDGPGLLPVDLAANARSYGIDVIEVGPGAEVTTRIADAVRAARASERSTLIHVESDPTVYGPDGAGWWDVPVAAVSTLPSTEEALAEYRVQRERQRPLLGGGPAPDAATAAHTAPDAATTATVPLSDDRESTLS
ncbi:MAG: thiamine pyrophosphate-dependent enzyme, partial [Herbiconiux sp.]|nr:thiamine pyrophosphate-dependent enzyme [Herbiconiux sp.]